MSLLMSGLVWKHSRHDGSALLLLLAIADYADDHGVAYPSIVALRRKARLGDRAIYRFLSTLRESGELEVLQSGSGRTTTRYKVVPAPGEQLVMLPKKGSRVPPKAGRGSQLALSEVTALSKVTGVQNRQGSPVNGDRAPLPESTGVTVNERSDEQSKLRAQARDAIPNKMATPKQIEREQHLFGKEAEGVWEKAARKVANPYTDHSSLRGVHEQAIEATRWATEAQVLKAIAERMDPEASPRRIQEWAREQAADEEQRAHEKRKREEKEQLEAKRAVEVEEEWQRRERETGKSRRELMREMAPRFQH